MPSSSLGFTDSSLATRWTIAAPLMTVSSWIVSAYPARKPPAWRTKACTSKARGCRRIHDLAVWEHCDSGADDLEDVRDTQLEGDGQIALRRKRLVGDDLRRINAETSSERRKCVSRAGLVDVLRTGRQKSGVAVGAGSASIGGSVVEAAQAELQMA